MNSRVWVIWLACLLVAGVMLGLVTPVRGAITVSTPFGATCGRVGTPYYYSTSAQGGSGSYYFTFEWDDYTTSTSTQPASSWGVEHAWQSIGKYSVQATARDTLSQLGVSDPLTVTMAVPPTAPVNLKGVWGHDQVVLTWSWPLDYGFAAITHYRIYRGTTSGGEALLVEVGDVLTYTDTGLIMGVEYYYQVSALNCAGEGPRSTEEHGFPRYTAPGEPTLLTAVPDVARVTLTWRAPASDGGWGIEHYRIYRGTTPGSETRLIDLGDVLTYVDTGLTNGQQYCYQVSAMNSFGEGPRSNELCASTPSVPGGPTGLNAAPGNVQVTLTWTAPINTGGSPITNYRIYRGTTSGSETFLIEVGDVLTYVNTGLTNGATYCYQVSAKNAVGEGPKSNEGCGIPRTVPGAPTGLTAVAGNAQATLTWTAPASNGGSSITNYRIYQGTTSGSETFLIEVGNVLTHTDTGLTNGVTYFYKLSAKNALGEGPKSNEVSATPRAIPSEPLNPRATADNGQVVLAWDAPASDGGSPITNYRISRGTTSGGEAFLIEVGNVLTHTDTGLTNGVTYFYRVSAKNDAGEGLNSAEVNATPRTTPSKPLNLQATAGNGQVTLLWAAPFSDGGSPVTNYRVYRGTTSGAETSLAEIGNTLTYTDTGLTNGQGYFYKVSARNVAGEGPTSDEANATPRTSPSVPLDFQASPGNAQVTLTWLAPSTDGGAAIMNYKIYRGTTSGSLALVTTVGSVLTYTDTGLTNGQTYYYQVSAVSPAGEGPRTAEVAGTPKAPLDIEKPSVVISSPTQGATLTAKDVTITGSASDNVAVAKVELSKDGVTWVAATGTSTWYGTLTLAEGTNTIYVRATDTSGNTATTQVTVQLSATNLGPSGTEVSLWVWALAVIVIAAVVAVAVMLLRRRARPSPEPPPPASPP